MLVIVSNPLDAMCHVAKAVSKLPRERVIGMAGILDTARFACFIAQETGLSVKDVTATVLGGHGDQMVPVVSATTVGGIPLDQLVSSAKIRRMVERTKVGGGELVKLLGTSAWYAPGAAAAQMVDAICLDEKRVLPCTAYLQGEYGIRDLYMGVPVKLGAGGAEEIVKLRLTAGGEEDDEGLRGSCPGRRAGADAPVGKRRGTLPHRWISASQDVRRSCSAPRRAWGSRSPRRSPRKARTCRSSPAGATCSNVRRSASERSPCAATSPIPSTCSSWSRRR